MKYLVVHVKVIIAENKSFDQFSKGWSNPWTCFRIQKHPKPQLIWYLFTSLLWHEQFSPFEKLPIMSVPISSYVACFSALSSPHI